MLNRNIKLHFCGWHKSVPDLQTKQAVSGRHKQEHPATPATGAQQKTCSPKQKLGFKADMKAQKKKTRQGETVGEKPRSECQGH